MVTQMTMSEEKVVAAIRVFFPEGCALADGEVEDIDLNSVVRRSELPESSVLAALGVRVARSLGVKRVSHVKRNGGMVRLAG